MVNATIAVLAGDGIGAEVTAQAVRLLDAVAHKFRHSFRYEPALLGGAAIDATGVTVRDAQTHFLFRPSAQNRH